MRPSGFTIGSIRTTTLFRSHSDRLRRLSRRPGDTASRRPRRGSTLRRHAPRRRTRRTRAGRRRGALVFPSPRGRARNCSPNDSSRPWFSGEVTTSEDQLASLGRASVGLDADPVGNCGGDSPCVLQQLGVGHESVADTEAEDLLRSRDPRISRTGPNSSTRFPWSRRPGPLPRRLEAPPGRRRRGGEPGDSWRGSTVGSSGASSGRRSPRESQGSRISRRLMISWRVVGFKREQVRSPFLDPSRAPKRRAHEAPLVLLDEVLVGRAVLREPDGDLAALGREHGLRQQARSRSTPPGQRTTARSIAFSSSRTLPGHSWSSSASERLGGEARDRLVVLGSIDPDEVLREQRDVLPAVAQRRDRDHDDAEAVVEVVPEPSLRDHLLQVHVGRGDDPHVGLLRLDAPDPHELLFLDDAEQLRLSLEADRADLVEEDRPPLGRPRTAPSCSRPRP